MRWFSPIPLLRFLLQARQKCVQTVLIAVQRAVGLLTQVFIVLVVQQGKGQLTSAPHILQDKLQQVLFLPSLKLGHQACKQLHTDLGEDKTHRWLRWMDTVVETMHRKVPKKQTHMGHPSLCNGLFWLEDPLNGHVGKFLDLSRWKWLHHVRQFEHFFSATGTKSSERGLMGRKTKRDN